MYEVHGRRLRRLLYAPLADPFAWVLTIVAVIVLFGNPAGWAKVAAAVVFVVLELRTMTARLQAGPEAIWISNRVLRHRIPWAEVKAVWSTPRWGIDMFPDVAVSKRRLPWFGITVYATIGSTSEECAEVVRKLTEIAADQGLVVASAVGQDEEPRLDLLEPVCNTGA